MKIAYPRILVISHNAFSSSSNNGKTFESLFQDWPKSNIAQLFFSSNEGPDTNFTNNYFQITDIDVLKRTLLFWRKFNISNVNGVVRMGELMIYDDNFIISYLKREVESIVPLRDLMWKVGRWKSKELFSWMHKFNPQIIFYVGGDAVFSNNIAVYLKYLYNLPLMVFYTDDYIIYPKPKNILQSIQLTRLRKVYRKTISISEKCFAISERMCQEYSNRFNKDFHFIMNSIEISRKLEKRGGSEVIISYFGGLHTDRWKMIVQLSQLKNRYLNRKSEKSILIYVYSESTLTNEMKKAFLDVGIEFKGPVYGTDFKNAIFASDILLHVESGESYNRLKTRLSISTKIPEYLMSGRLVLGYGPPEVESMRVLIDNKVGYFISSDSCIEEQNESFNNLIDNYEEISAISDEGYRFATRVFSSTAIRNKFVNLVLSNE